VLNNCVIYDDERLRRTRWYLNDVLHHDTKPAETVYNIVNKHLVSEAWYTNGLRNSVDDNPAVTLFTIGNQVTCQEWWQNNRLHRENNPAFIPYTTLGTPDLQNSEWWWRGERLLPHQVRGYQLACDPATTPLTLRLLAESSTTIIRLAAARHPNCPLEIVGRVGLETVTLYT